jgi:hypothetical protein
MEGTAALGDRFWRTASAVGRLSGREHEPVEHAATAAKPRAAAVARGDVRPAGDDAPPGGRIRDGDGYLERTGPEHGMDGDATLCGLAKGDVMVLRHLWRSDRDDACQGCVAAARGAD